MNHRRTHPSSSNSAGRTTLTTHTHPYRPLQTSFQSLMFITIKRAKDTPMTYESVPTEDILTQQAEYEKMGPYGAQIAYAVALSVAGVVGVLVVMCLLHTCFRRRREHSAKAKNLRPLKLSSPDTSTTSGISSTLTVEQEAEKQVSDPEKTGRQVRVFSA